MTRCLWLFMFLAFSLTAVEPGTLNFDSVMLRAAAVNRERFPDADTVLIDDLERVVYNPDATDVATDDYYVKILTEKGRRENELLQIRFNDFYQKVEILALEIVKPDLKRIPVPLDKLQITVDSSGMSANIYDPADKLMSVGIPGLALNDVVHYNIRTAAIRPRMRGIWCGFTVLQSDKPVLNYTYIIDAPASKPLAATVVKDEAPGTLVFDRSEAGGRIVYRWRAANVPRLFAEPDMPPLYLYAMRILTSTAPDWATVSRWYSALCEPHLATVTPEMREFVAKLIAGAADRDERIARIFNFVATEVRYLGVTDEKEAPGYEPHDVRQTFENRHGVCRDKAALLVAMLRLAKIDANMVLFMAGQPKDPEVANNYFNHAVVAVKNPDGSYRLMDPTDESALAVLPAYHGDKSYLVAAAAGETLRRTPDAEARQNLLKITSTGGVDRENRLNMCSKLEFFGVNDTIYRSVFSRWQPAMLKQFAAAALKRAVPGAELAECTLEPADIRQLKQPLVLTLKFTAANFLVIGNGDGIFAPPFLGGQFGAVNFFLGGAGLEKRRFPLKLESAAGVEEHFTLTTPREIVPAALPQYATLARGGLDYRRAIKFAADTWSGDFALALTRTTIEPAEYARLKEALVVIENDARKRTIIKRQFTTADLVAAGGGVQSIVEDAATTLDFKDVRNHTLTRRVKRRVLTYGGVKNNAELTVAFLDGYQLPELLDATVTAPDGTVKTIAAKEINIVDSPDAAAAPRYPKTKYLVAAFPGVAVGSVIDYTLRIRNRDLLFDDHIAVFGGADPTEQQRFTVHYPTAMLKQLTFSPVPSGLATDRATEAGKSRFTVTAVDLAARPVEPGTPPLWSFAPTVTVSAFSFDGFAARLYARYEELSDGQEEAFARARALTAGVKEPRAQIRILRDFVDREIRAAGPALNVLPLERLSAADQTLRDRYGNSADRAILLGAMLKAIHIAATPVAVSDAPAIATLDAIFTAPPKNLFTALLLRVQWDGDEEIYLNDTDLYAPLGATAHDGCRGLDLVSGELIRVEAADDYQRARVERCTITLDAPGSSGVTLELQSHFFGMLFARMNKLFSRQTPEERRRYFQELTAEVAQSAKALENRIDFESYPAALTSRLAIPDFIRYDKGYCYFTLPDGGARTLIRTAGARRLPYLQAERLTLDTSVEFQLPENSETVELLPGNWSWSAPNEGGTMTQEVTCSGRRVTVRRELRLVPAVFGAAEYPAWIAAQALLNDPLNHTVLIKLRPQP